METSPSDPVRHALAEGAERSRAAARPDGTAPVPPLAPVPGPPEPLHLALWRRHRWKIYGLLFLLVTELCLLMLGQTLAMGPG